MLDDLGDAATVTRADFAKDPLADPVEVTEDPVLPKDADVALGLSEAHRMMFCFSWNRYVSEYA